jgi:leader peptidase (prepilin peptidase)/N-methyltransferase
MLELLSSSPAIFVAIVFAFALLIGSFLNVVVYRLPLMMERDWREQCKELASMPVSDIPDGRFDLVVPRSRCTACGHPISAIQNIPVLSYLILGGNCANCKTPISARYPVVEAATAILAAIVAWRFGLGWEALMGIVLTLFLVPITLIDFDHQLIPDSLVLPLLWVGLIMSLFSPIPGAETLFISSSDAVIGAVAGYLILWTVYQAFKLVTGKEGMGYGDFKLLAALGAWLGWQQLPIVIILSALVGSIVGISLILFRGRDRQIPLPFGPYLAAAGWIALLWGDEIWAFYWALT